MSCDWCISGQCRSHEDTCGFKNLEKKPEAIKKRMDEEFKAVKGCFIAIKVVTDDAKVKELMVEIYTRLSGIRALSDVLKIDFNDKYMPGDPMEFTKLVIDAKIHSKKLERRKK